MQSSNNFPLKTSTTSASPAATGEQTKTSNENQQPPNKKRGSTTAHHVVNHSYHDHANDICDVSPVTTFRGGVTTPFPIRLHQMLERIDSDGMSHIVSWQPHGRCFLVHKPKEFVEKVMPMYFNQSKLPSFQRQLNLYGFCRLTRGLDAGGYYHELFLRGKSFLTQKINRMKVKGNGVRPRSNPNKEPNFYAMPPVGTRTIPLQQGSITKTTENVSPRNSMVMDDGQSPPSSSMDSSSSSSSSSSFSDEELRELDASLLDPLDISSLEDDLLCEFAGRQFHFVGPVEVQRRHSRDGAMFMQKIDPSTEASLHDDNNNNTTGSSVNEQDEDDTVLKAFFESLM